MDGVFRPALVLLAGKMLGYVTSFAIPLVLVRVFDPATFGTYKQLFVIFGTVYALAQFGVTESLYYFIPEDRRRAGHCVFNALIVLTFLGGAGALLLWLARFDIADLMNNALLADGLHLLALYTFFMLLSSVLEVTMTARNRHVLTSATYAISDTTRALMCMVPAVIFHDLQWVLVWTVIFAALRLIATLHYLRLEFGIAFTPQPALALRQLAYAGPFGLAQVFEILQFNLHFYFVSHHFDAATFAIYAIACLNIPIVDHLVAAIGSVLMVRMRELAREGAGGVLRIWNDTITKLALVLFPAVVILLAIAEPFIRLLFTATYQAAAPLFMLWLLGFLFAVLPTDAALRVYAQHRTLLTINILRLLIVATLLVPAMHAFGLAGPILVTLLAVAVTKFLGLIRIRTLLRASTDNLLPWGALTRTLVIASAAALPVLLLRAGVDLPDLVLLLSSGILYGITYVVLLLRFGRLGDDERRAVTSWMRWPVAALARARGSE